MSLITDQGDYVSTGGVGEQNPRDAQCETDAVLGHYFYQDLRLSHISVQLSHISVRPQQSRPSASAISVLCLSHISILLQPYQYPASAIQAFGLGHISVPPQPY